MTQQTGSLDGDSLSRKLSSPSVTFEEVLREDSLVQDYKQGEPKVHEYINTKCIERLIQVMTIEGPEQDQLRSRKFPQVACDILSCGHPNANIVLLAPANPHPNSEPLCQLLDYFQGAPNDILSGYVIRVLSALYTNQPVKTQDFIFRGKYANQMARFLSSRSVAEFLVNLIAIEDDRLLTYYINERNQLLSGLADTYAQGALGEQEMAQLGFALYEIMFRLWDQKHKQSAQFASTIFRISQIILDNNNNLNANNPNLLPLVIGKFALRGQDAPFLVRQSTWKIIHALSTYQPQIFTAPSGKETVRFSKVNLKLLCALSTIVTNNVHLVAQILKNSGCFALLLDLMARHQLNNMVHIEIEKIFKAAFLSDNQTIYAAVVETGQLVDKIQEMVFHDSGNSDRVNKGYTGCMVNILVVLKSSLSTSRVFGQLKRTNPNLEGQLQSFLSPRLAQNNINLAGCRLKLEYAIPDYNEDALEARFKGFFEDQQIHKEPGLSQNLQSLQEIINEGQLNKQWGHKASV